MLIVALVCAYTPGTDDYVLEALVPLLHPLNGLLFDGPASISNARTTTNKNTLPTLKQLKYYNYYSAATYYGYDHADLSCEYCLKFRSDVHDHKGNEYISESGYYYGIEILFRRKIPNEQNTKISNGFLQFSTTTCTTHWH